MLVVRMAREIPGSLDIHGDLVMPYQKQGGPNMVCILFAHTLHYVRVLIGVHDRIRLWSFRVGKKAQISNLEPDHEHHKLCQSMSKYIKNTSKYVKIC